MRTSNKKIIFILLIISISDATQETSLKRHNYTNCIIVLYSYTIADVHNIL